MEFLLYCGYEFLAAFGPFLVALVVLTRRQCGKGLRPGRGYAVGAILLALYVICVFNVTGTGTLYNSLTYPLLELREGQLNLVPFSQNVPTLQYGLNVLLFVPFGFLVPHIWEKLDSFFKVLGAGFGFSLLIELSQLLNPRSTDVDDLITNTAGAVLGWLLFRLWDRVTKSKYRLKSVPACELAVYLLVLFFGRFLLFDELGVAGLLYGF